MDEVLTTLKICIVGDSGVGKSSLLLRFVDGSFIPQQLLTVGIDFKVKNMTVDGNTVKLAIWDTAGQERYKTLIPSYYRDAHGAILVYSVSNEETYRKIEDWLNELDIYSTKSNMIKMIVGNKIDLEREVTKEEGIRLAKKHSALFIECSAKTNIGVQSAFEELVRKIIQTPGLWELDQYDKLYLHASKESISNACRGYKCTMI